MELAKALIEERRLSARKACRAVGISRTRLYYQPVERDDAELIAAIRALIEDEPAWGQDKIVDRLRTDGHPWNAKRIRRVYKALKLHLRRRGKKRLPTRVKEPLAVPAAANECWSADFMSDALYSGRRFRTFNVMDDFNREGLGIEIDTSIPGERVVRALDGISQQRGALPARIRLDNGPEFICTALASWASSRGVRLQFIQPGKPTQNAFIERFNRTYRTEVLDAYLFQTLDEVRGMTQDWLERYNNRRPHDALGGLTPVAYARSGARPGSSSNGRQSQPQTSLL